MTLQNHCDLLKIIFLTTKAHKGSTKVHKEESPLFRIQIKKQKKTAQENPEQFLNLGKKLFFSQFKDLCLYDFEILFIPQA